MNTRDVCIHLEFSAFVEVHRLFDDTTVDEAKALTIQPDSLAVNLTAECAQCGIKVRFEGPVGIAVGPGAHPMVSLDGLELRAAGHLGENRSRSITARLRHS